MAVPCTACDLAEHVPTCTSQDSSRWRVHRKFGLSRWSRKTEEWKSGLVAAKFELKKTSSGQYRFNLKAGNGEIIATSESYTTKASALNGIESVKKNAAGVLPSMIRRSRSNGLA